MKSPDEIKKGLKEHAEDCCSACPYWDDCNAEDAMVQLAADALALIQQLEARVPRWISVEERLPEHMDDVLVWVGGLAEIGCHDENDDCWELYTYVGDGTVTHWMPLPKPPKESP